MPAMTGDDAAGHHLIAAARAERRRLPAGPRRSGAARCTVLTTPPSLICTVFALTTGSAMPPSGSRVPRDAAAGAVSVIASWASASSTVDAVVHTCLVSWPSSEICSGRLRRSTMVSLS